MGCIVMTKRYLAAMFTRVNRRRFHVMVFVGAAIILLLYQRIIMDSGPTTGSKYKLSLLLFGERKLPQPTQPEIDNIADNLVINYTVLDNFISRQRMGVNGYHLVKLSMYNKGSDVIPAKRWEIYTTMIHVVEPYSYPYPDGFYFNDGGFKVSHVAGSLYKFEPVGGYFHEIKSGESIHFNFKLSHFQVSRTDSFPRWYVSAFDKFPRVIQSTVGEHLGYLGPLLRENQVKRRIDDSFHPLSASERYQFYQSIEGKSSLEKVKVLPTPLHFTVNNNILIEWHNKAWFMLKTTHFASEMDYLNTFLKMKVVASKPARRYIQFVKGSVKDKQGKLISDPEAYSIQTDPIKYIITITSSTNQGAFYGIQTLLSLVYSPEASSYVGVQLSLPAFNIIDAPRFSYRGLHIDLARNFHDKDQLMKIINTMSMYKMNKLHLHLSDDEGWRLEIPGLPELTQIGSFRCHDPSEEQCLLPQLGSGPYSNTSGSGYYTVEDYRDILSYATKRHVEIIPEFDMPGHSRAAIKSIHAKSQKFNRVSSGLPTYSIIEENDKSIYKSAQHYSDDVINPCMTLTYKFIEKIITEVKKMHADIMPLKLYHFGGDEVAKGAWALSDECEQLKQKIPDLTSQFDLMSYFVKNVARLTTQANLSLGCWEDGMMDHDRRVPFHRESFRNKDIFVYVWKLLKMESAPHRVRLLANTGYKVVLSHGAFLYFDHPCEPDPEERGLYWATRWLGTHKAWSYTPELLNADGNLTCPEYVLDESNCYNLKKPENIVGMEAHVWTETIRTSDQLDYMIFPRLLAVAERSWHKGVWENEDVPTDEKLRLQKNEWTDFISNVGNKELRRLGQMGIKYRIPPPGAIVKDGRVSFKSESPGLDTEYYSVEEAEWKPVSHNMKIIKPIDIRNRKRSQIYLSNGTFLKPPKTLIKIHITGTGHPRPNNQVLVDCCSETRYIASHKIRSPDKERYSRIITVYPWDTGTSNSNIIATFNDFIILFSLFIVYFTKIS